MTREHMKVFATETSSEHPMLGGAEIIIELTFAVQKDVLCMVTI